jgi:hypothetical protein
MNDNYYQQNNVNGDNNIHEQTANLRKDYDRLHDTVKGIQKEIEGLKAAVGTLTNGKEKGGSLSGRKHGGVCRLLASATVAVLTCAVVLALGMYAYHLAGAKWTPPMADGVVIAFIGALAMFVIIDNYSRVKDVRDELNTIRTEAKSTGARLLSLEGKEKNLDVNSGEMETWIKLIVPRLDSLDRKMEGVYGDARALKRSHDVLSKKHIYGATALLCGVGSEEPREEAESVLSYVERALGVPYDLKEDSRLQWMEALHRLAGEARRLHPVPPDGTLYAKRLETVERYALWLEEEVKMSYAPANPDEYDDNLKEEKAPNP